MVAGVLFARLLKQSTPKPVSMEEKLLGPDAATQQTQPSNPGSLADVLAQKDQEQQ